MFCSCLVPHPLAQESIGRCFSLIRHKPIEWAHTQRRPLVSIVSNLDHRMTAAYKNLGNKTILYSQKLTLRIKPVSTRNSFTGPQRGRGFSQLCAYVFQLNFEDNFINIKTCITLSVGFVKTHLSKNKRKCFVLCLIFNKICWFSEYIASYPYSTLNKILFYKWHRSIYKTEGTLPTYCSEFIYSISLEIVFFLFLSCIFSPLREVFTLFIMNFSISHIMFVIY